MAMPTETNGPAQMLARFSFRLRAKKKIITEEEEDLDSEIAHLHYWRNSSSTRILRRKRPPAPDAEKAHLLILDNGYKLFFLRPAKKNNNNAKKNNNIEKKSDGPKAHLTWPIAHLI